MMLDWWIKSFVNVCLFSMLFVVQMTESICHLYKNSNLLFGRIMEIFFIYFL